MRQTKALHSSHWRATLAVAPLLLFLACQSPKTPLDAGPPPKKVPLKTAKETASFVFAGTVLEVGAVSFSGVQATQRTIVVRVDDVIDVPAAVGIAANDKVTVAVQDPSRWRSGQRFVIYAVGWIYGEGVAVQELAHTASKGTKREKTDVRRAVRNARTAARVRDSNAVVVGRVLSVRPMPVDANKTVDVTEHVPVWREAVIEVQSSIKGAANGTRIVVRFPASNDIAWFRAPKLKKGQRATLFLKRDVFAGPPKATVDGTEYDAYTALAPKDVGSTSSAKHVRAVARKMSK